VFGADGRAKGSSIRPSLNVALRPGARRRSGRTSPKSRRLCASLLDDGQCGTGCRRADRRSAGRAARLRDAGSRARTAGARIAPPCRSRRRDAGTFLDVTAERQRRARADRRNQALISAEKLRTILSNHVSYRAAHAR